MLTKGKKEPIRFPAFVFDNTKDKNESVLDNKATMQVVRRCQTSFIKYLVVKKLTTTKAVPLQGFILLFSLRGSGEHNGLESQENKVAFVIISKLLSHLSLSLLYREVTIPIIIALPYLSVIWVQINTE